MKLRNRVLILLSCAIVPSISVAEVAYTPIADTAVDLASFGLFPSINSWGTVAFNGSAALGSAGIYTGDGGALSSIAEFQGQVFSSSTLSQPTINDSGVVTFYIGIAGASTLYVGTAGALTTIAASDASLNTFFGLPAINSSGTVAFGALYRNSSEAIVTADGGVLTTIAQQGPMFSSFHNNGGPSINNSGTVAFTVDQGNGLGLGVFVNEQGNIRPIALSGPELTINEGRPALNNDGITAFLAFTRVDGGSTQGIFRGSGDTPILVTTGNFSGTPALNDIGAVAYNQLLSDGRAVIFINFGPQSLPVPIIATGDSLSGSTVSLLGLSTYGLNDANQVAFGAQLADGRRVIIRADVRGGFRFDFDGNPGQQYIVQRVDSLPAAPSDWQFISFRTANPNGTFFIIDYPPAGTTKRFYRAIIP